MIDLTKKGDANQELNTFFYDRYRSLLMMRQNLGDGAKSIDELSKHASVLACGDFEFVKEKDD